ncbi:MAG TPA: hypothetical protein VN890_07685 [Methylocella sp.]|nr:hypothetical protein [Methylocella sp.]
MPLRPGDTGAGHPVGLFAANQVQNGEPQPGQAPERGVIEVKSAGDDAWLTANAARVSKYFGVNRLVIVTNIRDFLIIGRGRTAARQNSKAPLTRNPSGTWPRRRAPAGGSLSHQCADRLGAACEQAPALPELEEERGKAEKVKQEAPILIMLGNPPYNGFAGMAVTEERAHSTAYRTTTGARRPKARG